MLMYDENNYLFPFAAIIHVLSKDPTLAAIQTLKDSNTVVLDSTKKLACTSTAGFHNVERMITHLSDYVKAVLEPLSLQDIRIMQTQYHGLYP